MTEPRNKAAIRTRYLGPTTTKPPRISVTDGRSDPSERWRLIVSKHSPMLSSDNPHRDAAQAWLDKFVNTDPDRPDRAVVDGCGLTFRNDEIYYTWCRTS